MPFIFPVINYDSLVIPLLLSFALSKPKCPGDQANNQANNLSVWSHEHRTKACRRVPVLSAEASLDPAYSNCGNASLGSSDVIFQEMPEMWSFICSLSF